MDTSDTPAHSTTIAATCIGTFAGLALSLALGIGVASGAPLLVTIPLIVIVVMPAAGLAGALWFPFFFAGRITSRWKQLLIYLLTAFIFLVLVASQVQFDGP